MLRELENIEISVDDRLTKPKLTIQKAAIAVAAIVLILLTALLGMYFNRVSDPYVREVLALNGDYTKGYAIFQINCAGCHQGQVTDSVGPNLEDIAKHRSKVSIIYQVTSGKTPPMPKFQPDPQEMADLLNYLEKL